MSRTLGRWVAAVAVATVCLAVSASLALASSAAFKLSIAPGHVKPGGTVTISTTPRQACKLKLTVAGRPFSHSMPNGVVQVQMPKGDVPGKIPVQVTCGSHTDKGSFTVSK